MAGAKYYVMPNGQSWGVRHCGALYPYDNRKTAIRAAIDAAYRSGRNGHEAQVFSPGADGNWQIEWAYGRDPYPPIN